MSSQWIFSPGAEVLVTSALILSLSLFEYRFIISLNRKLADLTYNNTNAINYELVFGNKCVSFRR